MLGVHSLVQVGAVLGPAIRVMDQRLHGFSLANSFLQCFDQRLHMQTVMHMMTHDLA